MQNDSLHSSARSFAACVLLLGLSPWLASTAVFSADVDPMDWPAWRGPSQNSHSAEVGLIDRFDPDGGPGSNVLWKSDVAAGISTPIVMNGRLFTITRDSPGTSQDAEKVVCLNAGTGDLLWQNVYNVFLSDLPAERVGWSHVCGDPETNRVYALGACCYFQCIDAETGKTIWSRSLSEEFGMLSTYGGRTNTPILFEDLVIISGVTTGWDTTARPAHRFLAFEKESGELVWITSTRLLPEDTTFSTPVVRVIDGQQVMVAGAGDGDVYGIQPRTGKILWKQPLSRRGVNTSVAFDEAGNVYAAHGEENPQGTGMGAVVRIDAPYASLDSASAEKWRSEDIMVGKSSPLCIGNRVYVVEDSSRLHVLDTETGETIGKPLKLGTSMRGSLLYADGKIYACTSSGIFHVLRPTDDGIESVFKVRLPSRHEVGGSPIVAHGRIYLPTTAGLYCLGSPDVEPKLGYQVSLPVERNSEEDRVVAQLQLVPAEAIVPAGATQSMQVHAFNAKGQRISESPIDVEYSVSGSGTIDANGLYQADASDQHQAVIVTASLGDLQANARLRIIPPLPWTFDFTQGGVPVTWVGAAYRHEPRVIDGNPAIVKITTIPKGTRSQSWFGPTDLHDYTIVADIKAVGGTVKLPDMGVIAQRYTLDMMGESQQLQIRTWAAQLRMARTVDFAWKADQWYRLKLRAANENGFAVLQGKAWPRDEEEPAEWTVTAKDESPNTQGSPGLFGNATNAEIIIDNVSVTPNE